MTPEQVQARLAFDLPPATLVLGAGAWREVCRSARSHWMMQPDLSADRARILRDLAWLLPTSRGQRVMAVNLDGASDRVQDMLLKILEEPPETTRFVLAASRRPLPTVTSRCRVLVLGGAGPGEASASAADVAAVGTAIRAARARQPALLYQVVRGWWKSAQPGEQPAPARLLPAWAAEAASERWQVFSPDTAPGVSPDRAVRLLAELARRPGSRLGPAVALETVFSQE